MYRILTENKNVCEVKRLLVKMNLDYTMYYGDGPGRASRRIG
jgi:hypothetical protein